MAVVGAAGEVDAEERLHADVLSLHVERGSEGTGTVGRRTHAALDLYRLHAAGEVAHVDPEHLVRLGVVHRYAVGRDVDAAGIRSAHSE